MFFRAGIKLKPGVKWFGGTHHISNSFFHIPYKLLSKSTAPPNQKLTSVMFTYKLYANVDIQITFQVICMPQANDKRIADEHKTWKVICIAKSPGTTDENLKFPSPLHPNPKLQNILHDSKSYVCKALVKYYVNCEQSL